MNAATLASVLAAMARLGERGITFVEENERTCRLPYSELFQGATAAARRLRGSNLSPGSRVAIVSPDCRTQVTAFWACVAAGCTASILPAPSLLIAPAYYARLLPALLAKLQPECILTDRPTAARLTRMLVEETFPQDRVSLWEVLLAAPDARGRASLPEAPAGAREPCYIQFSSGTSGEPKGIVLTHSAVVANLEAIGRRLSATGSDIGLSWLPLYHDMGLIGGHLLPAFHGMEQTLMRPIEFAARPHRWLSQLSSRSASLTVAPSFAFDLCLAPSCRERLGTGLDLSHVRAMLNGSEPIRPAAAAEVEEAFARFGMRPGTIVPCYGLGEATLAVTVSEPGRRARVVRLDRHELRANGLAVSAPNDVVDALSLVSCGAPVPGVRLRILGTRLEPLRDGETGEIAVAGPSLMAGYLPGREESGQPESGPWLRDEDGTPWLRTGDLGFTREGELFVTGRLKDTLVVRGRNVDPAELEEAAEEVPGVRKGHTVAFSFVDPVAGREVVVLLVEADGVGADAAAIRERVGETTGVAPDRLEIVARGTISRTTSGKKMRRQVKTWYLREHGAK